MNTRWIRAQVGTHWRGQVPGLWGSCIRENPSTSSFCTVRKAWTNVPKEGIGSNFQPLRGRRSHKRRGLSEWRGTAICGLQLFRPRSLHSVDIAEFRMYKINNILAFIEKPCPRSELNIESFTSDTFCRPAFPLQLRRQSKWQRDGLSRLS